MTNNSHALAHHKANIVVAAQSRWRIEFVVELNHVSCNLDSIMAVGRWLVPGCPSGRVTHNKKHAKPKCINNRCCGRQDYPINAVRRGEKASIRLAFGLLSCIACVIIADEFSVLVSFCCVFLLLLLLLLLVFEYGQRKKKRWLGLLCNVTASNGKPSSAGRMELLLLRLLGYGRGLEERAPLIR